MASERNGKESSADVWADENDHISIDIPKLFKEHSRESFIFKVPHHLRQVNERSFEPRIISIGPYHHGKDHLAAMEIHKLIYLEKLLERRNESCVKRYMKAMRNLEEDARRCYAKPMDSENFALMLVLDGCFVIELIRKFACNELKDDYNDDLFKLNFNHSIIGQELLLVENQLPFFVLEKLFTMTKTANEEEPFVEMALRFFSGIVPGPGILVENYQNEGKRIKHLLGLVHDNWLPSSPCQQQPNTDSGCSVVCCGRTFLQLVIRSQHPKADGKWKFIRSARELLDLGIKFKKISGDKKISLFDIKFEKNRLYIPTLKIDHDTERIFRNFIAYEQFNEGPSYVMDYTRFIDCLINYGEDVALLSNSGIIDNWLGSNEEVANMFNKLNDFVYLSTATFYYSKIFNDVNKHCRSPCARWKVKLRSKYFNTPWDWVLISIIAGSILLLLTLVQTIFTVLSYINQGN